MGSSLCILLQELLDLPGTRSRIIGYTWETSETPESACYCQARTGEGELPGVGSRKLWQLLMIVISCP